MILASASSARVEMLRRAGVPFVQERALVDEGELKASFAAEGERAEVVVEALAETKAQRISARREGALVIGADQMLECDGVWFDKPKDMDRARADLRALRGRTHRLLTCACVVRDGRRLWHRVDAAELTMRPFSDAFLDAYLAAVGPVALESVGAYRLEEHGAQLMSRVRGDHFTILGLPLLPLLEFLRGQGVVRR